MGSEEEEDITRDAGVIVATKTPRFAILGCHG